jgi:hypothetical protein
VAKRVWHETRAVSSTLYKGGIVTLRMLRLLLVLGLAEATAGCFGLLGGGGPESSATLVVRNDVDPPTAYTIELRRSGGDTETLGPVAAGEERSLSFSSDKLQGTYQLIARQSSGAAVTSREFTLFADARGEWQVRSNVLTVAQPR